MDSRHERFKKFGGRKMKYKKVARHVAKSKEESLFIGLFALSGAPLTKRKA